MKKNYEEAKIEIIEVECDDIITTSNETEPIVDEP